jgi:hypothetical protein
MIKTQNIYTAAKLVSLNKKVCFVINKHNKWNVFIFWFYQMKFRTYKSFHCIIYNKKKTFYIIF